MNLARTTIVMFSAMGKLNGTTDVFASSKFQEFKSSGGESGDNRLLGPSYLFRGYADTSKRTKREQEYLSSLSPELNKRHIKRHAMPSCDFLRASGN